MADQPFNSTKPPERDDEQKPAADFNAPPAAEAFTKPETPALDAKKFNFAAWLHGVTPIRETVTIFADGHAQAEISRLAYLEAIAPDDNGTHSEPSERQKIVNRLRDLYAAVIDSGMDFVIEGRNSTWVSTFAEQAKADGITDPLEVTLRQIAAQIVSPEGVSYDGLKALHESREQEVNRLAEAVLKANSESLRVDPRFLPTASA